MKNWLVIIFILGIAAGGYAQKRQLPKIPEEKYTTGLFKGDNAYALVPEHDPTAPSFINVFHYLQSRVPGLQIYGATTQTPTVFYRMGVPAFFLDEIRVNLQTLLSISLNDVAYIKVFRPPFLGGYGGGNGAIAVYTKEGEESEE